MLIRSIDMIIEHPAEGLIMIISALIALVVAITFHEFSHALSANILGDLTATRLGRLSLNPKAHLDPIGSIMILLAGFGWGKPVPVNSYNLRSGGRYGMAAVAASGPISNIFMAVITAIPVKIGLISLTGNLGADPVYIVAYLFQSIIYLNLALATFNLLPIAPLDGFKVVLGCLPRKAAFQFAPLESYGPMILLGLILVDYALPGHGILSTVISHILTFLIRIILG